MRVVFVRPNYPTYFSTPPLGLGYLSACTKKIGAETLIIDGVRTKLKEDDLIEQTVACLTNW